MSYHPYVASPGKRRDRLADPSMRRPVLDMGWRPECRNEGECGENHKTGFASRATDAQNAAMDLAGATEILKQHRAALSRRGVARLDIFGSTARGESAGGSDIDIVVDIEPDRKFSLIDQASLRVFLCEALGSEVDVVVREDLRPHFRAVVDRDAVQVI